MAEGSKSEKMVTLFTSQYDIVLLYVEDFFLKSFLIKHNLCDAV